MNNPRKGYNPFAGRRLTAPPMSRVVFSSSWKDAFSADHLLTQATALSLAIPVEELLISAVIAERYGEDWYLWVRTGGEGTSTKSPVYHALSITINGRSLGHYLEAIVAKGG
jgi:hypothetical protein